MSSSTESLSSQVPPSAAPLPVDDQDVAVGGEHRAAGRPDRPLAAGRHHEVEARALPAGGDGHHRPDVLAAVAVQSAEADVDVAVGDRERGPLLDRGGVLEGAGDVHLARPLHRPGGRVEGVEDVDGAGLLGHHEDRLGGGVVGGGAGHPEREDVAAGEVGLGHRGADVVRPDHRPGQRVEGVEGVVLGGDDDVLADHDRLRPDRPVEVGVPPGGQGGERRACWAIGRSAAGSGGRRARRRHPPGPA